MTIKIVDAPTIKQNIIDTMNDLSNLTDLGIKVSRMPDGSMLPDHDPSAVLKSISPFGGVPGVVRVFVQDACKRAEQIGPASADVLIRYSINLLNSMRESELAGLTHKQIIEKTRAEAEALILEISRNAKPITFESLERIVGKVINDEQLTAMIVEAIRLAGSECKILVEPTPAIMSSVEKTEGYTFNISPDATFYNDGRWSEEDVKCLVVDGIIESVAEVDTLFNKCHEEGRAMIVFARGFRDDVLNTLRVNRARKTLNVIPVKVAFDLESANVLNDLAVVSGTDVISSLKGELISTVQYDELPTVKRVTCVDNTVNIENSETAHRVENHTKALQEKRSTSTIDDITSILDSRIRSLSGASVIIRVAMPSASVGTQRMQRIDIGLRVAKSLLQHGSVAFKDIECDIVPKFSELPAASLVACVKYGSSLALALLNTGCAVVLDLG